MYTVVSSETSQSIRQLRRDIEEKVNAKLEEGYTLVGGLTTSTTDTQLDYNYNSGGLSKFKPYVTFHQAMIKYSKHEKEFH